MAVQCRDFHDGVILLKAHRNIIYQYALKVCLDMASWVRMAGAMGAVMLLGWGLMKTTSPSREDMLKVRSG